MSLKVVSNPVSGTASTVGGADWNRVANLLNAGTNILTVDINSDWKFRDTRCKFTNGSNICSIRTGYIDRTLSYYLPRPADSNDDTIVSERSVQTLTHKTIEASANTLTGFVQLPSARKWGCVMVGSGDTGNPGMGLLAGYTHNPTTPTFQVGATNGLNWRYNSGSSANTVCGLWAPNTAGLQFANRTWHCSMRAKTRVLTGPTATRQYVGFTSRQGGRLPGSDSPIATDESAILIGWRTSDVSGSNPLIKVFTNSGAGSMTVQTTQVAPTTAVTQYAIDAVDANPTTGNPAWRVRVLSPSGTTTTSDQYFESNVPANGTPMVPVALYSTTSTNTNYDLYFLEMSQDQ